MTSRSTRSTRLSSQHSRRPTSSRVPNSAVPLAVLSTSRPTPPSPSSLLSCHTSLLQLRTDLSHLSHTDLLLKTQIRTYQRRIAAAKQHSRHLSYLPPPPYPPPSSTAPPPLPLVLSSLLSTKQFLESSIADLDALAHTHSVLTTQLDEECREVLNLRQEEVDLSTRLEDDELARREEGKRMDVRKEEVVELLQRLRDESAEIRRDVVELEEELIAEEERSYDLRQQLDGGGGAIREATHGRGQVSGGVRRPSAAKGW